MKVQISYVHWGRVLSAVILIVFLALTLNLIVDLLVFHLWNNPEQEQIATQVTETSRRKPRSFKAGRKAAFLFGEGARGLDIPLILRYNASMSTENKETQQKMSIYFPLDLLERVRKSARANKRSFNKEVQWLVEQGLERHEEGKRLRHEEE